MTPRADALAVLLRNRRRMDAERRGFADRVSEVVARRIGAERRRSRWQRLGDWVLRRIFGRQPTSLDMLSYALIRRDLEPILDEFYGAFPGDRRARFWTLIVDECRAARALAFQRATADVRRRLQAHPDLLRAIREAA